VNSVATTREVATSTAVFGRVGVGVAEVWVSEMGVVVEVRVWVWMVAGVVVGYEAVARYGASVFGIGFSNWDEVAETGNAIRDDDAEFVCEVLSLPWTHVLG
jgi:hypothetical protein